MKMVAENGSRIEFEELSAVLVGVDEPHLLTPAFGVLFCS